MPKSLRGWLIGLIVVAAAVTALALVVRQSETLPTAVVDIVWDKETCAHCHMHIGDPLFAAQLQTEHGEILDFDDPGCLLSHEIEHPEEKVHAVYVHAVVGNQWLPREKTAFSRVSTTPMGFGLGAVELGTPGSIPWADARAEIESARRSRLGLSGSP